MKLGRRLVLICLAYTTAFAQDDSPAPKKQLKVFVPPVYKPPETIFYWSGMYLARDRECAADYSKAISLAGLERQKMLTDLVTFHCAIKLQESTPQSGSRLVMVIEMADVGEPPNRIAVRRVEISIGPKHIEGWVLASELTSRKEYEQSKDGK